MHRLTKVTQGPRSSLLQQNGSDVLILENESIKTTILPGRGASVVELQYKPLGLDVLLKMPGGNGAAEPYKVTDYTNHSVVDNHPDGWFSCFPSGGAPAKVAGNQVGFHGEVWGLPFTLASLKETPESVEATFSAKTVRTPFRVEKKFTLKKGEPTLFLDETVHNDSPLEIPVLWGHHPTLGAPFIDEHARIEIGATGYFNLADDPMMRLRWPHLADGTDLSVVRPLSSRQGKMVFATDFAEGKARVVSPTWKLAYELTWNAELFPYCWIWENAGQLDAPWFGRSHALALEPYTGLAGALEEGHGLLRIGAGQSHTASIAASLKPTA